MSWTHERGWSCLNCAPSGISMPAHRHEQRLHAIAWRWARLSTRHVHDLRVAQVRIDCQQRQRAAWLARQTPFLTPLRNSMAPFREGLGFKVYSQPYMKQVPHTHGTSRVKMPSESADSPLGMFECRHKNREKGHLRALC